MDELDNKLGSNPVEPSNKPEDTESKLAKTDDKLEKEPARSGERREEPMVISVRSGRSRSTVRKLTMGGGILLLLYLVYTVIHLYASPDRRIQQIYLVPEDAAFIVHSASPVDDWKLFSSSATWRTLKRSKSLAEMTQQVERLDSIIGSNKNLLSLVGKRDMLVSIHKTRATEWDYLLILDMLKASKLDMLKEQIELILRLADYTVTHRTYNDIHILEMRDPKTRNILYGAFVDNHFVASHTSKLVEASIDARLQPKIGLEHAYIEAEKAVAGKGLYRLFIHYSVLPQFLPIYLGGNNEYIDLFCHSMDFAGLYFNADHTNVEMKGTTFRKEIADPYITALLNSGKHKMKAHEIMSARTALYTHIGIGEPLSFVKELEAVLSTHSPTLYSSYTESRKKIENTFGISLDEHFLSWMSGEFALSQSEPGLLGREPEQILVIGAKNIQEARTRMEYIEKKVKSRTPIKVKSVDYKGFEVNYIEMKGFFRLFFGKLFDSFEKPYYTYIDNYVVFSNQASSLLSFIEDYEQKNLLKNDHGFQKALKHHASASTLFVYTDVHKFYPQLQPIVNAATWTELQTNRDILYSFPYWSMQISGENHSASLQYVMDFTPYVPVADTETDPDKADTEMNEDATTEKELMNELKRFYIEKFQGNVLREFYPDGDLKSETEVKEGMLHGRHREYYDNGKLRVRGKYVNNRAKGTWKYYTSDGKFERKQKF